MNPMPKSDLWQAYCDLPIDQKTIVRIASLTMPPFERYSLQTHLPRTALPGPNGKTWSYNAVRTTLDALTRKGLLTQQSGCVAALLHPVAIDAIAASDGEQIVAMIHAAYPAGYALDTGNRGRYHGDYDTLLRQIRLAIYTNDIERFSVLRDFHDKRCAPNQTIDLFVQLYFGVQLEIRWLNSRHPIIQIALLQAKLAGLVGLGASPPDLPALVTHFRGVQDQEPFAAVLPLLLDHDLLAGRLADVRDRLPRLADPVGVESICITAALDLLTGQAEAARQGYRAALKRLRKNLGRRKVLLDGIHGILFLLAMLQANDATLHPEITGYLDNVLAEPSRANGAYWSVQALLWLSQGFDGKIGAFVKSDHRSLASSPIDVAFMALAEYAYDPALARKNQDKLINQFHQLKDRIPLLARIHAEILAEVAQDTTPYRAYLIEGGGGSEIGLRFTRLITMQEPWERALGSLDVLLGSQAAPSGITAPAAAPTKRLAWFIDPDSKAIDVVEQSAKGTGWSDGRPIALKRLYERDPRLTYLTPEDRAGLAGLRRETSGWNANEAFEFDPVRALPALVGHPAVFDARHRARRIELVNYPLELIIAKKGKEFRLTLSHTADQPAVFLEAETPARYRVIEFPKRLLSIQEVLGRRGLTVPARARDQVIALVRKTNPTLPIRSEIEDIEQEVQEGVAAPVVQIIPQHEGLKLNLMVRPFGPEGPAYVAGLGGRSLLATIAGQQVRVNRDLADEVAARNALIDACPTLRDRGGTDVHELVLDDLEGSLELLLELQTYGGPSSIEWPEGQRMRVSRAASDRLRVQVTRDRDWFNVAGTIDLDEDRILEMRFLLERLGRARGRFVPLEDGSFVALTHQLQTQLQKLTAVSEVHRPGHRVHALGAPALEAALSEGGTIEADAAWKRHVTRINAAERWTPQLPANLQAELRDYQIEGFVWLSRLARWGAGACLADDMGLGKTVQTIAVLLDRALDGPCLVVAPTSVCPNWTSEIRRFAPTLAVHRLSTSSDRAGSIARLSKNDVLICSYGLLHQESDALAAVAWSTVVLDEAQAIKNADTKRAQASLSLQADFRVVLTGTPVENYLDELWSLFNFLNPGLLGSREGFQKRFAIPIERDRDPQARHALRTLIRPFLLRRTKAAVLSELPPRIEQTVVVEMNEAERAFYEALRQQALDNLENLDTQAGKRKIHILAEITRLRRACCNPALIDPSAGVPSSKLETFLGLVSELIRNRHRALVFSQFVGHLALIRAALDERGIAYEYLDGSTPSADRERRVAAFQAGTSDLFLISLRAGGTGLNLTAADYVVHLDPWWNPAVEDQASDRAHRIGQERPVTIYRLIMEGSIEERIIALHRDKRDLASELLEGGEVAARLTEDELIDLIRV
ncbi:DEAD/DEAH box helicase [Acidiphilium acidophilum]|uniref:DEAD/DEAH box helicase n=1 Tax=Acidiphilium acidophilum TaxID=76588 RepID=UPI002E8E62F3|nr:DEAD/DEAH box helicase [Acidiphilium acidophilum]